MTIDLAKHNFVTKTLRDAGLGNVNKRMVRVPSREIISAAKFIGPVRTVFDISSERFRRQTQTYNPARSVFVLRSLQQRYGNHVVNFKRGIIDA